MPPHRLLAALLGGAIAAAAAAQAPPGAGPVPPPGGKDDMSKSKTTIDWPTQIGGRDVASYVKDFTHPDPTARLSAVQTIPAFGPDARKAAGKALVDRLKIEVGLSGDPTVAAGIIDTIGGLGLDDADMPAGAAALGLIVQNGANGGLLRQHAVPVLASFGPKAPQVLFRLTDANVIQDRSFETRRLTAAALARVGMDEHQGPDVRALNVLTLTMIKDASAAVRMEAFQTLLALGPPWKPRKVGDPTPPAVDTPNLAKYVAPMKARLGVNGEKEKQIEVWCRLAVMRFDKDEVNDANLTALANLVATGADAAVKIHALNALAMLGEFAAPKIEKVKDALRAGEPGVVDAAVKALVAMGPKGKPAIPAIKEALAGRTEEYFKKLSEDAVKALEAAKGPEPGGPPGPPPVPPKK